MTRSRSLVGRLFLFTLALSPAGLIAGCFGDGAADPDAGAPAMEAMGGATGTGGGPIHSSFVGIGGATGSGGAPGAGGTGAGGSNIGPDGPRGLGGFTGGLGGAGAGGSLASGGSGGAGGPTPVCSARCFTDGPFCQCAVIPGECPQVFQVVCPTGAAGTCSCRINGATVDTVPGAACDTQLLTAATACGFAVVISN